MTDYTVLGARGFIGSHLLEALKRSSAKCYAPVRGDAGVFDRPLGTVFYCIGLTNDYKDRPFETIEAHVSYLSQILAKAEFSRLVYLSSTRLYDGLFSTNEETDLILNPRNPRHMYDLSKALGESLCLTASNSRACVARLSSVYGDAPSATGFLPDLLRRLKNEKYFALESSTGIVRDYIHIDDVVSSLMAVAAQENFGIVNVGSGENLSNQDIADALNACGFTVSVKNKTERQISPACDITKLASLGIKPQNLTAFLKEYTGNKS